LTGQPEAGSFDVRLLPDQPQAGSFDVSLLTNQPEVGSFDVSLLTNQPEVGSFDDRLLKINLSQDHLMFGYWEINPEVGTSDIWQGAAQREEESR
jgi:hypothetical protein